jgi:hypothetical protein
MVLGYHGIRRWIGKQVEGLAQTGSHQSAPTAALINNKAVPILSQQPSISDPYLHTT